MAATVRDELASRPQVRLIETQRPAEIDAGLKEFAEAETIVAAGGDGTIHQVLNAMHRAGCKATLGVLPLGTGNNFCRTLGIPLELTAAVDLLTTGERRLVDLGVVRAGNQTSMFVNLVAGGNSVQVNEMVTEEVKATWGPFCYLRGAIEKLGDLQGYDALICFDDGPEQQFDIWNILIANGRTVGVGIAVAPLANPEDGLLDVILIPNTTLLDAAAMTAELIAGDYLSHEGVVFQRARRVAFRATPHTDLAVDGEILSGEAYEIEVLPQALRVIVGSDYHPQVE
jgi:diacylglycerol kinase (ATP)